MVLIQSWAPHLALAPIAQADPPLMPFRDAGYSQADYGITVQDVVYGVWRAKEQGFCALPQFDLEEYERYERVDQGDFNWLTPDFLAFASPQHTPVAPISPSSPLYATLPSTLKAVEAHTTLPTPFKNVLKHFTERNIGLVVRLNSELYSPSYFTALGIEHLDMIFDDGTCPPLTTVRKFITLAHEMITVKKRGIAVHCKAGLGRTGCLIGAYLIYRYGFTANEIIAYMRFMRPGMVVGPQQHWLHLNQGTFREWWLEEQFEIKMKEKMASMAPSTPTRLSQKPYITHSQIATPPNGRTRSPLGEVDKERHHPYGRSVSIHTASEEEESVLQRETEMIHIHRSSMDDPDGEEEWAMRMRSSRKSSRSPGRTGSRSISQTTTTIYTSIDNDSSNDVENIGAGSRPKTPGSMKSGSGSATLSKVRGSPKRSGDSLRGKEPSGVRKTSGRVGSVSTTSSRKISGLS